MHRFVFLLLAGVLLFGCAEPAPTASASPVPTAFVSPSVSPASPSPTAEPSPSPLPSAIVAPPLPTAVAAPASAEQLAAQVAPIAQAYFNSSATMEQAEPGRFVLHERKTGKYEFSVVVSGARLHWTADDTRRNVTSESGVSNGALVFQGNTLKQNGFLLGGSQLTPRYYGYFATMKCFGQKYDLELHVVDYLELEPDLFRQDLGPSAMAKLVAACPA